MCVCFSCMEIQWFCFDSALLFMLSTVIYCISVSACTSACLFIVSVSALTQKCYRAMYSYTAAEADEVSLQEGDVISDVEPIDEGWVFGCNQRTGQRGMLPANYVRPVWDRHEGAPLLLPTVRLLFAKESFLILLRFFSLMLKYKRRAADGFFDLKNNDTNGFMFVIKSRGGGGEDTRQIHNKNIKFTQRFTSYNHFRLISQHLAFFFFLVDCNTVF